MRKMRKLLCTLLCLMLVFTMMPMATSVAFAGESGQVTPIEITGNLKTEAAVMSKFFSDSAEDAELALGTWLAATACDTLDGWTNYISQLSTLDSPEKQKLIKGQVYVMIEILEKGISLDENNNLLNKTVLFDDAAKLIESGTREIDWTEASRTDYDARICNIALECFPDFIHALSTRTDYDPYPLIRKILKAEATTASVGGKYDEYRARLEKFCDAVGITGEERKEFVEQIDKWLLNPSLDDKIAGYDMASSYTDYDIRSSLEEAEAKSVSQEQLAYFILEYMTFMESLQLEESENSDYEMIEGMLKSHILYDDIIRVIPVVKEAGFGIGCLSAIVEIASDFKSGINKIVEDKSREPEIDAYYKGLRDEMREDYAKKSEPAPSGYVDPELYQKMMAEITEKQHAEEVAEIKDAVDNTIFKTGSTKQTKLHGKKAIKITWSVIGGKYDLKDFEGFDVYRSTKKSSGYGTKPFFTTTKWSYLNNKDLKVGQTYYYKVRAWKTVDGEKYYTGWSTKAHRTVK